MRLDDVVLTFPPANPPPLLAGVRGPKSLNTAGATCDGVLLAEPASSPYIAWARAQVETAAAAAQRPEPEIAVYTWCCVDRDSQTARQRLSPILEENLRDPEARIHLRGLPFADELSARLDDLARVDDPAQQDPGAPVLEPEWMDQLAVVGTAGECAAALRRLAQAGAGHIILLPLPGDERAQIQAFAHDVRPHLA